MNKDTRTIRVTRTTSTAHRLAHYNGVCGNVHGHNMKWMVEAKVEMSGTDEDNMPVDFKTISDMIDEVDHATILNAEDDPLVEALRDGRGAVQSHVEMALGDVIWFQGDPTCEQLSMWMAHRLVQEINPIIYAEVELYETSQYSMEAKFPKEFE